MYKRCIWSVLDYWMNELEIIWLFILLRQYLYHSCKGKISYFDIYGQINVCHFMHATPDVCDATASVSASFSSCNFVCDNLTCISKFSFLSFSQVIIRRHIYPNTHICVVVNYDVHSILSCHRQFFDTTMTKNS